MSSSVSAFRKLSKCRNAGTQKENFGCKEKNSDADEKTQKTIENEWKLNKFECVTLKNYKNDKITVIT